MDSLQIIKNKIFPTTHRSSLITQCSTWRAQGLKIVFTNGCFDLLHRGHIELLSKASDMGDVLVVGLNTDASVRRLKGENRPVNDEEARALVLAALGSVDAVALFDEDTPYELIKALRPDVLVKGADYKPEEIVGYDIVTANGGVVKTVPLVKGYSTTSIIDRKD